MPESAPQFDVIAQALQRAIDEKRLSMPMLPQITSEVLALVNDENSNAAGLAKLIQTDQALAGHVMRIANSAAYSPAVQLASLQQAIARLGMRNIAEISMAAAITAKLFDVKGYKELVGLIWRSSLATGAWAREIARQTRRNVESIFLCGLLHQLGKPVVLQTAIDIARKKGETLDAETVDRLLEQFELTVGLALARHWRLPEPVIASIAASGGMEFSDKYRDAADSVLAARIFADYMLNTGAMEVRVLVGHPAVVALNLYPDDIEKLLDKEDDIRAIVESMPL